MSRLPRLILSAYTCHPTRGSEPTVGWNRAVEAARFGQVDVITHDEGNEADLQQGVEALGLTTLRFHVLPHTPFELRLRTLPGGHYFAHRLWNHRAFRYTRALHQQEPFDLAHQVNLCSFRAPGNLWKLGIPFVWGPFGGTQNTPARYLASGGLKMAAAESVRTVFNTIQLHLSRRVRHAARAADALLVANSTIERDIERALDVPTERLLETGIRHIGQAKRWADREPGPFRLLWAGEVISRKGIRMMLDAYQRLRENARAGGPQIELTVVGQGPDLDRVRQAEGVRALGWIPRTELLELYHSADAFAFTSLRDTTGNVVLEALAAGLPMAYFDHQGVHDVCSAETGIPIPVSTPDESVDGIVRAVTALATDPARYERLSQGAVERARDFHWRVNGDTVNRIYADLLGVPALPASAGDGTTGHPALADPSYA